MKMNPSASIETSAGVPIAWAFIGINPLTLFVPTRIADRSGPDGSLKVLNCEASNSFRDSHIGVAKRYCRKNTEGEDLQRL